MQLWETKKADFTDPQSRHLLSWRFTVCWLWLTGWQPCVTNNSFARSIKKGKKKKNKEGRNALWRWQFTSRTESNVQKHLNMRISCMLLHMWVEVKCCHVRLHEQRRTKSMKYEWYERKMFIYESRQPTFTCLLCEFLYRPKCLFTLTNKNISSSGGERGCRN